MPRKVPAFWSYTAIPTDGACRYVPADPLSEFCFRNLSQMVIVPPDEVTYQAGNARVPVGDENLSLAW